MNKDNLIGIILIILFAIALIGVIEITKISRASNPDTLCNKKGYDAGEYENFKNGKPVWDGKLICYDKVYVNSGGSE